MTVRVLKKLYVFFLIPVTVLCGCETDNEKLEIATDFSADFTAEYRGYEVKGSLSTNRQGVTSIRIDYPETISGINFNYKNSELEMSRENLICSADEAYLPQTSFPGLVRELCRGIGNGRAQFVSQSEDKCTYNLKVDSGSFTVITDSEGKITDAQISEAELSIIFSDTEIIGN